MLEVGFLVLMCSLWSALLTETPIFIKLSKAHSDYWLVSLILKAIQCELCRAGHLLWISYFIIYASPLGILLSPLSFWLTFLLKKYLFNISI